MNNSDVDWIGEMPEQWGTIRLKYVFTIKKEISNQLGYKVLSVTQSGLRIKDISSNQGQISADYSKYQLVDIDDFVMNHMDLITGWVDCSRFQGVTSPDYRVFKLIDVENQSKKFYTYLFQACYLNKVFYGLGQGVSNLGRWRLQTDKFLNFMLPKLSRHEQQAIAMYLNEKSTEIDSIIKNTELSIEEYKKYKQSIITETVTKGLNLNVPMKDSGVEWIGEIPGHWGIFPIKYILRNKSEKNHPEEEVLSLYREYGVIPKNSRDDNHNVTSEDTGSYKLVEVGDFVINKMKAWQGSMAVSDYRGIISPAYHVCTFTTGEVNKKYFHFLIRNQIYLPEFRRLSTGLRIGQWDLSFDRFKQLPYLLPPIDEQNNIVNYLEIKCAEIDNLISEKQRLISELVNYKKSLMYECVTGKRDVRVTEKKQISAINPQFPAALTTNKKRFAQAVLASKVIDSAYTSQFGRVKLEKILYTIETHIGFDFDTDYKRQIAGPLDGSIYQCEHMISQRNKWFKININKNTVKYSPSKDMENYKTYYKKYYSEFDGEIERIINIFRPLSTDQAEIFATLYASWNDFIIGGNAFAYEDIVSDVLNNWHDSKKRFSKDTWLNAIEQMIQLELVPKGYGKKSIKE